MSRKGVVTMLRDLLLKAGVLEKKFIEAGEVEKYPKEKIVKEEGYHYLITEMTNEEIKLALLAKQTIHQKTIKNIVVFNLVTSIVAVVLVLIMYMV